MSGGKPPRDLGIERPGTDRPQTAPRLGLLLGAALVFLSTWIHVESIGSGVRPGSRLPEDDLCCWSNSAVTGQGLAPALRGQFYEPEREGFRNAIRPLPLVFLRMEHSAFGESGAGYRVIQLLLLGAVGALLFLLLEAWWGSVLGAALGAMLLVVHPLSVPAVAGIAGVSDLLALAFLLGALWAARTNRGAALSSGLILLAALCNEMAFAVIPAVGVWAWVHDRHSGVGPTDGRIEETVDPGRLGEDGLRDGTGGGGALGASAALGVGVGPGVGAVSGAGASASAGTRGRIFYLLRNESVTAFAFGSGLAGLAVLLYRALVIWTLPQNLKIAQAVEAWTGVGLGKRLLVGLAGFFESFRLIVFPRSIGYANDYLLTSSLTPLRAAAGLLLGVIMVWVLLRICRRDASSPRPCAGHRAASDGRPVSVCCGASGAFWIAMVLFPVIGASGLVFPTGAILPPRAVFFVLPGVAGLVAWGVQWALARRRGGAVRAALAVLGATILGLACWRTIDRTNDYQDWETLVQRQTIEFPRSAQGWFDLGNIRLTRGERAAARSAYEIALKLRPNYWEAGINLGVSYLAEKEWGQAMRAFTRVVDGTVGNKALRIVRARARFHQGLVFLTQAKNAEAARCFEDMLAVFPNHLYSHANLGMLYSNSEPPDDRARMHLERALQLETAPERRTALQGFLDRLAERREGRERHRERISGDAVPGADSSDHLP